MMRPHRHRTTRRLFAATTAALLALVGLLVPVSAGAAGPTRHTTVDVTEATAAAGLGLRVAGFDYTNLPDSSIGAPAVGVYVGLRDPADSLADIAADLDLVLGTKFLYGAGTTNPDWTADVNVDAGDMDPDVDYQVIVWAAHGNPTSETVLDSVPLNLSDAQKQALFPGWTPATSTTTSTTTTTTIPSTDPWSTQITVTQATAADGLHVGVEGTDYANLPSPSTGGPAVGVYVGLRDPADPLADIAADLDLVLGTQFLGGVGSVRPDWATEVNVAAADMDPDVDYQVMIWVAHGNPNAETVLETIPLNLTDAQKQALFSEGTPPTTNVPTTQPPPTTSAPETPTTTPATPPAHTTVDDAGMRCVTETVTGTVGTPELSWGVRSSFVNYIEGAIGNGSIETTGGVIRSGNSFTWPNGTGEVNEQGQGTWSFSGAVHFSAHNGVLNTTLSNLRIRTNGSNGSIVADVQSQDMEGNDVSGDDMAIAELHFSSISPSGGSASAKLTADGARALNGMYEPGTAMAPVTVDVSGGTAGTSVENCYDADGNLVSSTPASGSAGTGGGQLPATGFGAWPLAATGMIMVLIGLFLLTVTNRRRRIRLPVK